VYSSLSAKISAKVAVACLIIFQGQREEITPSIPVVDGRQGGDDGS